MVDNTTPVSDVVGVKPTKWLNLTVVTRALEVVVVVMLAWATVLAVMDGALEGLWR